jgi:hypothetical protein
MPLRILSLVKIEHPARGLIQNSRFGFLATVDEFPVASVGRLAER